MSKNGSRRAAEFNSIAVHFALNIPTEAIGNYYWHPTPPEETQTQKNNYKELESEASRAQEVLAKLGPEGLEALHKDCLKVESTHNREKFVHFFQERLVELKKSSDFKIDPKKPISMEALLGPEGLKLYKKATKEEGRSRAFRNAVFVKSTTHYKGQTWDEPKTFIIAGASATGKSFCTEKLIEKIIADTPKDNTKAQEGNNIVAIDGGIDRELSQMRQLCLQGALYLGDKGISDLHSASGKISIKEIVQNAALSSKTTQFSLAIPLTFANPLEKYFLLPKLKELPGRQAVFAFVKAKKKSTAFNGMDRAWSKLKEFDISSFVFNNRKIGCESKIYEEKYFHRGNDASKDVMESAKKEGFVCYEINNERVALRRSKPPEEGAWLECAIGETAEIQMSQAGFDRWKSIIAEKWYEKESEQDLPNDLKLLNWSEAYKKDNPINITQTAGPIEKREVKFAIIEDEAKAPQAIKDKESKLSLRKISKNLSSSHLGKENNDHRIPSSTSNYSLKVKRSISQSTLNVTKSSSTNKQGEKKPFKPKNI